MKKKKKPTKKQCKNLTILYSVLAVLWIIQAVDYACSYKAIRQVVANAEASLVMKIILAICGTALAITWIVQYTKYDELSKNTDE